MKYLEIINKWGSTIVDDHTSFFNLRSVTNLRRYTMTEELNISTEIRAESATISISPDTQHRHLFSYSIGTNSEFDVVAVYTNQYNSNVCYALSRDTQHNTAWILEVFTKSGHQADFNPSNFWVYVFGPYRNAKTVRYGLEIFNEAGSRIFSSDDHFGSIIKSGRIIDSDNGWNSYFVNHLAANIDLPNGKRIAYCAVRQQAAGYPQAGWYTLWPLFGRTAVVSESAVRLKFDQVNYFSKRMGTIATEEEMATATIYTLNRCAGETSYLLFDVSHIPLPD